MKQLLRLSLIGALLFLPGRSGAQIDDVRLWTGVSLQHKFTRQLAASIDQQFRFKNDLTRLDKYFTDIGIAYQLPRNFKIAIAYRFIRKNEFSYYSVRHRFYADLSYKQKLGRFTFNLRERILQQYKNIHSSELGLIPDWVLRSKLTAKYDLQRRYSPYLSTEIYYMIDNAKEKDQLISRLRYSVGVEFEFNRIHSLDIFTLFQHDRQTDFNSLVMGATYTYAF